MQPKRLAAYWFSRDGAVMALKLMGAGILVVFVVLIGLFAYFRKDLPKSMTFPAITWAAVSAIMTGRVPSCFGRITMPSTVSPYRVTKLRPI